jgi:hypothetical protein
VRGLIELQFERLPPEEQRVLEAASVAGSACTAAAMAAGLGLALEAVEERCASLAQRGQFLVASGLETWPDGTVTERYGWQHALPQEVVYARVPEGRRPGGSGLWGTGRGACGRARGALCARAGRPAGGGLSAAGGGERRPAACTPRGHRARHAGLGAAGHAPRDPGTGAAGTRPATGPGTSLARHQGLGGTGGGADLRSGAGVVRAGRRHTPALRSAGGLSECLLQPGGIANGAGAGGTARAAGPAHRRPNASPGGPLCARHHLVLHG